MFSAYPTCHDVNRYSSSAERLDVVVGFATGDLIWFGTGGSLAFARPVRLVRLYVDPISSRYVRINKQVLHTPFEHSYS